MTAVKFRDAAESPPIRTTVCPRSSGSDRMEEAVVAVLMIPPTRQIPGPIERVQPKPSHRQNDAELCLATHHARVSLGRFFERIGFNHGPHAG